MVALLLTYYFVGTLKCLKLDERCKGAPRCRFVVFEASHPLRVQFCVDSISSTILAKYNTKGYQHNVSFLRIRPLGKVLKKQSMSFPFLFPAHVGQLFP